MSRRLTRVVASPQHMTTSVGSYTISMGAGGYAPFILGLSRLGGTAHLAGGGEFVLGTSYIGGSDRLSHSAWPRFVLGSDRLGNTTHHLG